MDKGRTTYASFNFSGDGLLFLATMRLNRSTQRLIRMAGGLHVLAQNRQQL